ncbi:MAG: sigma-54 dependent transcriptional regulator [Proteobacteria bacterium]|nr:sigma-54 dependent transcriptional regulator [Pseudomonadota bacterium]
MAKVLIIDDDEIFSEMIADIVLRVGHNPSRSFNLNDGLKKVFAEPFDVVFLDIFLPDGNGLEALPQIREAGYLPEIIILTGFGDANGAELAIKNGAWDYIEKPSSIKEVTLSLIRALEYRKEKTTNKSPVALNRGAIIGNSSGIRACIDLLAKAASSDINVVITGETGTGKELFASAIHSNSSRAHKNFVVVDCASLPQTLVESILFGHEKGSFTGADKTQTGLIKQAHGGTLFLDEVGELPLSLQKNLLRALQEHRFRPVGSELEIESNFRLISATNKDLNKMVETGQFREDLLFRLRSLTIDLPPLRKHPEDIKELLVSFITKLCDRYGKGIKGFSPEFLEALEKYEWPGNVRELLSAVESAVSEALEEPALFPKHLPLNIRISLKKASLQKDVNTVNGEENNLHLAASIPVLKDFRDNAIAKAERTYLENILASTSNNIIESCRISGLSRPRLYALLKKYNLIKR